MKIKILLFILPFLSTSICFSQYDRKEIIENLIGETETIIHYDTNISLANEEAIIVGIYVENQTYYYSIGKTLLDSISQFSIGGVSKIFTYRLTKKILTDYNISSEEKLSKYLNLDNTYADISIGQLMNHTSGLDKNLYFIGQLIGDDGNPYAKITKPMIINQLNKYAYLYKHNNDFNYSHLNYGILEIVLENITGKTLCELMKMHSPTESLCNLDKDKFVIGYDKKEHIVKPENYLSHRASEGLYSTPFELLEFCKSELKLETSYRKSRKNELYFSAPWYIMKEKKKNIHVFTGSANGHSVFCGFNKSNDTAIVVFRNSEKGIADLGLLLFDLIEN